MQHESPSYRAELPMTELIATIRALLVEQREAERLLCRYLADLADRIEARRGLSLGGGYTDIYEAARCLFSMSVRRTRERVRIGRALRQLPRIEAAFLEGDIGYSQVREVTRVAKPATETEWLARARQLPIRTLERRVIEAGGASILRDRTSEPAAVTWTNPGAVDVRLSLRAETWALVQRAMEGARRAADEQGLLSDDAALAAVAKEALERQADGEPNEVHRTVVLYECWSCERTEVETGSGAVELEAGVAAALGCGAAVRDLRTEGRVERRGGRLPKSVERAVRLRDRARCRVPGCTRRRWVDVHHIQEQAHGGVHSRKNCVCLCDTHHRMLHEGEIVLTGDADATLEVRDARGERIGEPVPSETPRDPRGSLDEHDLELAQNTARVLAVMGRRGGWDLDALCEATGLEVRHVAAAIGAIELAGKLRMESFGRYRAA